MRAMPPPALFPETVTLNLLLGSDDPDDCNFKMVSSWPPCIQSNEKRDVCMPPPWHPILNITCDYKLLSSKCKNEQRVITQKLLMIN